VVDVKLHLARLPPAALASESIAPQHLEPEGVFLRASWAKRSVCAFSRRCAHLSRWFAQASARPTARA